MRKTLHTELVVAALEMAERNRRPGQGILHHSDQRAGPIRVPFCPRQGVQYASSEYRQVLERLEALQSTNRKGECWDNAAMVSCFATFKVELNLYKVQGSRTDTRNLVFEWIEVFHDRERRHSSLGCRSPTRCEERLARPNC